MLHTTVKRPTLTLILLLALACFLPGLKWGLPSAVSPETVQPWALDTIAPIAPLNEAYYRFSRSGNEYVVYPLMHYLVLSAAYAPYIGYRFISGDFSNPSATFPYGINDIGAFSRDLTLLARLVSLAMALAIVALVVLITSRLAGREAAAWAGIAACLLPTLGFYATTSNLDVPYSFWVMMAVYQYVLILDEKRTRHYALLGLFTAFAIASKDQAYGFFLLLPAALAIWRYRQNPLSNRLPRWLNSIFGAPMLIAAAGAVAGFALANNLIFGGFDGFIRHLEYGGEIYDYRKQANELSGGFADQMDLLGESLVFLLQMLGPVSLLLCLGGVVLAVREKRWALLSLTLPVLSYYVSVIAAFNLVFSRYLLVTALLMLPFLGLAAKHLFEVRRNLRWLAVATLAIAFCSQAALVANLIWTLHGDSRVVMEQFVTEHLPPGSRIETYVRQRMAPRVQPAVVLDVVGNSGDSITMDTVDADLTATALAQRAPQYILLLEGLGVTGDPIGWQAPALREYHEKLLSGELGYRELIRIETPHFLPFRQVPGTRPTSVLLERVAKPATSESAL